MAERHRLRRGHVPVDEGDQRFRHIADDPRPAGRAERDDRLAVAKDDGRRHRRPGALAALHPVGDGFALRLRRAGKIGEFVVQEVSVRHQAAAKAGFDGGCHRKHVSGLVADDDMGRAGPFLLRVRPPQRAFFPGRLARLRLARCVRQDQRGAVGDIGGVQQPFGHRNEIAVGHVEAPVGEGEAGGFGVAPPGFGVRTIAEVMRLQHHQDLPDGQRAGGGRAHAADPIAAIWMANGRAFLHLIGGEVLIGEHPRIDRGGSGRGDHLHRKIAVVERRGALFGEAAESFG